MDHRTPDRRAAILFVVEPEARHRRAIKAALTRRFGADYQVLTASTARGAARALERMARRGDAVAIVLAALRLAETDGVEFLEQAHALHPRATRCLLLEMDQRGTRIPFGALGELQRATALGRIDFWVLKEWVTPEEWLYPQVQGALSAWTAANRPHHEVLRIVGERMSPSSHELRDVLTRNTVPFGFYAVDSAAGRRLVRAHGVDRDRLPAVVLHNGSVIHEPTLVDIATALGVHTEPSSEPYDLAIVGAGPAGLAAAVYGASEGLRTLVIEAQAIGGQAGTSSMIRNYLGFPRGVSGGELAFRAWVQSLLFGAQFVFTRRAVGLKSLGAERIVLLSGGGEVRARAAIIAAGVEYRRLGIASLDRFVGAGVFYGAAAVEAPAMAGERVAVVGGANSAGQAALHLARYAERVSLLVRGASVGVSMSDYLVKHIEATPNIEVLVQTRVVEGRGRRRLEALRIEHGPTAQQQDMQVSALFVMIGAEPRTEWLADVLQRDEQGFILTGHDLSAADAGLSRFSKPFETSLPGVFAVGDVRHGSIKRVAEAVGEGSVAVGAVHRHLVEHADR